MTLPKIIEVRQKTPDLTHITWIINNICPNRCSYCPPLLHLGSNHNYEWNNAKIFVQMLLARYKKIHLSIGGGEPSMSPHLPELISMFVTAGHSISITSNAYRNTEYWQNLAPMINNISFSYHAEFSSEQYFKNVKAVALITRVNCRVMMLSSHWNQCIEAFTRLKNSTTHSVEAVRAYDWGSGKKGHEYTDEQIAWFNSQDSASNLVNMRHAKPHPIIGSDIILDNNEKQDQTIYYINRGQTNFQGYECDIGLRSLFIGIDGLITRGNCGAGGNIGSINKPELIKWPAESIICPKTLCGCATDVIINKRMIPIKILNIK
jgi:hypothetical protein